VHEISPEGLRVRNHLLQNAARMDMILIMFSLFSTIGASHAEIRSLAAGQHLFHVHDSIQVLYTVISGEITLERVSAHGARLVLQRAKPGDVVAEASFFSARYHCDAIAIVPSEVKSISIGAVLSHLSRNPNTLWNLTRDLAHQVQRARLRAEILSIKRLSERLDTWLLMNDSTLPPKGDWLPLAAELGVTPEALYRELAKRR
jgi:CRP/FNR family transcriptional regulator, dissimilatory nitrate respiration regulator